MKKILIAGTNSGVGKTTISLGIMQAYDYVVVNSVFGSETYVVTFIPKFDDNTRVLEVFAPFTIEYPSVPGA